MFLLSYYPIRDLKSPDNLFFHVSEADIVGLMEGGEDYNEVEVLFVTLFI